MTKEHKLLKILRKHKAAEMTDNDLKEALHRGWERSPDKVLKYIQQVNDQNDDDNAADEDNIALDEQSTDDSNRLFGFSDPGMRTASVLLGVGCACIVASVQGLFTKSRSAELQGYLPLEA